MRTNRIKELKRLKDLGKYSYNKDDRVYSADRVAPTITCRDGGVWMDIRKIKEVRCYRYMRKQKCARGGQIFIQPTQLSRQWKGFDNYGSMVCVVEIYESQINGNDNKA